LDPLASGILPVAVGKYTKLISYVNLLPKVYMAEITFGVASETLDMEGVSKDVLNELKVGGWAPDFNDYDIEENLKKMIGLVDQIPPIFSALKIDGKRAYKLARDGEKVKMKARPVECFDLVLEKFWNDGGLWKCLVRVSCGKGYYVRSMVRDLCGSLGVEGFMSDLIRYKVGAFEKNNSFDLDTGEDFPEVNWMEVLKGNVLINISEGDLEEFRNGRKVVTDKVYEGDVIGMFAGEPVSILSCVEEDDELYLKVKKNI
jgi:tRNA pseudouridine55 synthase